MSRSRNQKYFNVSSTLDKYIKKTEKDKGINEFEIRVKSSKDTKFYVGYGLFMLQKQDSEYVVIKATGNAIPKAINIIEILKRRVEGLHQINRVKNVKVRDIYEPIEEGLDVVVVDRYLSLFESTLTKEISEKTMQEAGYQEPLPENEFNRKENERIRNQVKRLVGRRGERKDGRDYYKNKSYSNTGRQRRGSYSRGGNRHRGRGNRGGRGKSHRGGRRPVGSASMSNYGDYDDNRGQYNDRGNYRSKNKRRGRGRGNRRGRGRGGYNRNQRRGRGRGRGKRGGYREYQNNNSDYNNERSYNSRDSNSDNQEMNEMGYREAPKRRKRRGPPQRGGRMGVNIKRGKRRTRGAKNPGFGYPSMSQRKEMVNDDPRYTSRGGARPFKKSGIPNRGGMRKTNRGVRDRDRGGYRKGGSILDRIRTKNSRVDEPVEEEEVQEKNHEIHEYVGKDDDDEDRGMREVRPRRKGQNPGYDRLEEFSGKPSYDQD